MLVDGLAAADPNANYTRTTPNSINRFSLRPATTAADFGAWPTLLEISGLAPFSGALEMRRGALLSTDRKELRARIRQYLDPEIPFAELKSAGIGPVEDMARFDADSARRRLLHDEPFSDEGLRQVALYPFENRWSYHTNVRPIWNEPRPELVARVFPGNGFVVTRFRARRPDEGLPLYWTPLLPGYHLLDPNSHPLPVMADRDTANLSTAARLWLAALGLPDPDSDHGIAAIPWHHALAVGYAPAWLEDNADGIRQNWPRVPLPDNAALMRASAALGARVAALLDPDTAVPDVTDGTILPALNSIAVPTMRGGGAMNGADRALTAGWGHAGKGGAVMPGRGRTVTRDYAPDEAPTAAEASLLGARTLDVFLNDEAYWRNIPEAVWNFTIGGYQVLKKFLSYREQSLTGRVLAPTDVRYVRDVARRLAALRLMAPALDANYRACAAAHRPLDRGAEAHGTDATRA